MRLLRAAGTAVSGAEHLSGLSWGFGAEDSESAEPGQCGVTSSMAVRGWHVSDRPARGSG